MKTLSHGFDWLRRLAFVFLLMGLAGHAMAATKSYTDNGDGTVTVPYHGADVDALCDGGVEWDNV